MIEAYVKHGNFVSDIAKNLNRHTIAKVVWVFRHELL